MDLLSSECAVNDHVLKRLVRLWFCVRLCFCLFSTVSEDKLDKHLKKCNSRVKPKPVRWTLYLNDSWIRDITVKFWSFSAVFHAESGLTRPVLQVYYVENINAGPADETLQQVTAALLQVKLHNSHWWWWWICCLCSRWVCVSAAGHSWRLWWTNWRLRSQVSCCCFFSFC